MYVCTCGCVSVCGFLILRHLLLVVFLWFLCVYGAGGEVYGKGKVFSVMYWFYCCGWLVCLIK